MKEYSQVLCMSSRIKEGCLEKVKRWLHTLENERRVETFESFKREGVLLEAAFIQEEQAACFLIYFMRAQDVQHAMQVFEKSQFLIDLFHKQCGKEFLQDHQQLTPSFHLEKF